jgi:hypothetical protein
MAGPSEGIGVDVGTEEQILCQYSGTADREDERTWHGFVYLFDRSLVGALIAQMATSTKLRLFPLNRLVVFFRPVHSLTCYPQ